MSETKRRESFNQTKIKIIVQEPTPAKTSKNVSSIDESQQSVFCDSMNRSSIIPTNKKSIINAFKNIKILLLISAWVISSYALMSNNEKIHEVHQISIPKSITKSYLIFKHLKSDKLSVMFKGAFLPSYYSRLSSDIMSVWINLMVLKEAPSNVSIPDSNIILTQNVSDVWTIPVVTEDLIGHVPEISYTKVFQLNHEIIDNTSSYRIYEIVMKTNLNSNFPVTMGYNVQPINAQYGILYAALVLLTLYVLIIFDLVHRTLAAMLASTMSLAILAIFDERPTMSEIMSWIDIETLMLLFSMMILVTILSETGIFDYTAVFAFKTTHGKLWPLINILCILTTFVACFLDNVTTALLITPVTIRLCEVMKINPKQILIYTLIFANIGGAITPIGDPPNVIIASNAAVVKSGVNFGVFTLHMSIGVLLACIVVYLQIRIVYRDKKYYQFEDPQPVRELKSEIAVWQRTGASVSSYSRGEDVVKESLLKQTLKLQHMLKQTVSNNTTPDSSENIDHETTLRELEKQYPIKNKCLLIKSGITLILVIFVFFLHSFPAFSRLGLGWTALLGALLLFILYDKQDLEGIFSRVEWSTLLFFASLFILMEALSRLGLIDWIGTQTHNIITSVNPESRLGIALILILWVSTIASAFVDNLPLTTMMIRIAVNLSNNNELHLPLQPLVWALSFGACLGGNGSLFGSSSNIVCAGLAEQHGYRFTFVEFLKIGLPVTVSSTTVITIYLIISHVIIGWH